MSFINHHFNINHCCHHRVNNWLTQISNFSFFNFNFNFWGFRPVISPYGFNNYIQYPDTSVFYKPMPMLTQNVNSWQTIDFNNDISWNNPNYNSPILQFNTLNFSTEPSWNNFYTPQMDIFTRTSSVDSTSSSSTSTTELSETPAKPKATDNKPVDYSNMSDINASSNKEYLKNLSPEMQEKTKKLIAYANENGYDVKITSGYRTEERQKELQEQYKDQPGRVAKNSAHCAGKAIDIKVTKNGKESDSGYRLLGEYAKNELNMRWGGDFKSFRERWHFDYDWA